MTATGAASLARRGQHHRPAAARAGYTRRAALLTLFAVWLCSWASSAQASLDRALSVLHPEQASLPVEVQAQPALGRDAPASSGWGALAVRLHNRASHSLLVTVRVLPAKAEGTPRQLERAVVQSTHWLDPGAWRSLVVPVPAAELGGALVLVDHDGELVGRGRTYHGATDKPHVFELAREGHLAAALRSGGAGPTARSASQRTLPGPLSFSSAAAVADPATDELLLPLQAAAYAAATAVWTNASQLERLPTLQWVALSSWLLAGGTLVISDGDPGPVLTSQRLRSLAGGPLAAGRVSQQLTQGETALALSTHARTAQVIEMPDDAAQPLLPSHAYSDLRGYQGGNLRDSPWGQVASYGLGELHLLAFEPSFAPFAGLSWTRERVEELVSHARNRQRHIALPLGKQNPHDARSYGLRNVLGSRVGRAWPLWLSSALLLSLALLAGPVNFSHARRRGAPLRALGGLYALSAAGLLAVVSVAALTRATHRSVKRLSLTEAGAGMRHASITRFRSFYTRDTSQLQLRPAHAGNVLSVVDSERETTSRLSYTEQGLRLDGLRSRPWKLLLVREEGVTRLSGSVTLLPQDGDLLIRNQLDRALESVVVRTQAGRVYYFPELASGTRTSASHGQLVEVVGAPARATYFPLLIHNFDWRMDEQTPGLADAWRAVEALRAGQVDWWPADVPVLLAQLDGGEGRLSDSGFDIESDRALLRVVGYGGER